MTLGLARRQLDQACVGGVRRDELLGRRRQCADAFEDGEREQSEQAEHDTVERTGAHGGDCSRENRRRRDSTQRELGAVPGTDRERLSQRGAPQLPVRLHEPPETIGGRVVGDELRQRIDQLDDAARDDGAFRGAAARGCTRETDDGQRDHHRAEGQHGGERKPGRRCQRNRNGNGAETDDDRGDRGRDHPHEQVLQCVDVRDEAAEQVAGPRPADVVRDQRLEPGEEPHAHARQIAERGVVGDEPFEVAQSGAREREKANAHDHDRERKDVRPRRGARDQVPRGGEQCGTGSQRQGRERDRCCEPALHAASAGSRVESRPPRNSSTRSAARSTRGSCVATITARVRGSAASTSMIRSAELESRCAVGSSSSKSGARRRSARANATRRCSPDESFCTSASSRTARPAAASAALTSASAAETSPSRTASATVPGSSSGRWGTQASCRRQAVGLDRREVDAVDRCAAGVCIDEAKEQREQRRLARPARPDDRDPLARLQLQVDPVQHTPAFRIGEANLFEPQDAGLGSCARRGCRSLELDQLEQAARRREPVGARMELSRGRAQGRVELRSQHEDRERGRERDGAVDEPDAELDGDDRSAERGRQLECERGQKGDAQRRHRGAPVVVGVRRDRIGLRRAAPVRAQRREAAHDIDEVGREERERPPAAHRRVLGRLADQDPEDRDQRHRAREHDRGGDVVQRDPDEEHGRDDRRERELRQEPGEVRLERIGAVEHGAGDLSGLQRTEPAGARPHELREHPLAQRRQRGRRGERATALERPPEEAARDGDGGECDRAGG